MILRNKVCKDILKLRLDLGQVYIIFFIIIK